MLMSAPAALPLWETDEMKKERETEMQTERKRRKGGRGGRGGRGEEEEEERGSLLFHF